MTKTEPKRNRYFEQTEHQKWNRLCPKKRKDSLQTKVRDWRDLLGNSTQKTKNLYLSYLKSSVSCPWYRVVDLNLGCGVKSEPHCLLVYNRGIRYLNFLSFFNSFVKWGSSPQRVWWELNERICVHCLAYRSFTWAIGYCYYCC